MKKFNQLAIKKNYLKFLSSIKTEVAIKFRKFFFLSFFFLPKIIGLGLKGLMSFFFLPKIIGLGLKGLMS